MCQLRCRPPATTVALQMHEHTTYELSSNAVQYKTCYAGSFLLKNKRQKAENLRKCQSRRLSVQAESRSLSDPFTARERRLLAPSSTITGSILGKMPNWDFAFTAVFSVLIHCCSSYILKARIWTPTIPQKNELSANILSKMAQIWPKMAQHGPRMTPNDPKWPKNVSKWPKNDARIYALFPQFFLTEKAVPQTFSLLECMVLTSLRRLYSESRSASACSLPLWWGFNIFTATWVRPGLFNH